jgi:hypothetical protein
MAKDANYSKTPQSGSKPAYVEPTYTRTAATISQKLRNNKGPNDPFKDQDTGINSSNGPSGGSTSSKGRKESDAT